MKLDERLDRINKVDQRMYRWSRLPNRDRFVWAMMRKESHLLLRRSLGLWWAVLRKEDSDRLAGPKPDCRPAQRWDIDF